jgi:hypothetical protein
VVDSDPHAPEAPWIGSAQIDGYRAPAKSYISGMVARPRPRQRL